MQNYKITVAYDGTRYKGWQGQKTTDATIQAKLEGVLRRAFGYRVEVIGSGRTDAGVHAREQVANFHLREPRDTKSLRDLFNEFLPEDIAVCCVEEVSERFHSRFMASEKIYRYRIHTGSVPEVFERKYVFSPNHTEPLDVAAMKKAAGFLVGTRDFTSFCGNSHMKKSAVRSVYEIGFEGPIRPDHGRMIWDEVAMPGYGLYDRALGAAYLNGLWEAIMKGAERR